jgi:hypothetical protein
MVSHFSETVSSATPDCRDGFWESDGHDWIMHEKLIGNTLNTRLSTLFNRTLENMVACFRVHVILHAG